MNIPFFPYSKLYTSEKEQYLSIIDDVCTRGAFILQKDLEDFEKNICNFTGAKYCYGVANGTDALILGLKASGLKKGDEVILPSHTYIASPASVHLCGGVPILTECGEDGMMDPSDIEHRITDKTVGIMPVHINGRTCDMDQILNIAQKYNLEVYEDAAQALGSSYKGKCAGTFGKFGTISLYPAKLLGCFGDGGLLLTNDEQIARRVSLLRDHGRDENGIVIDWGYNSRLDNLQAAVLNYKLKNYPDEINHRRSIAKIYNKGLSAIKEISLPPSPSNEINFDVYQNYELRAQFRDELKDFLSKKGIGTIIQWAGTPVHQFKALGFSQSLPITDKFFEEFLMLPMNAAITLQEAEYIVDSIISFYEQKRT